MTRTWRTAVDRTKPPRKLARNQLWQSDNLNKLILLFLLALASRSSLPTAPPVNAEPGVCQKRAEAVTIIRDDWGVPHVYGGPGNSSVRSQILEARRENPGAGAYQFSH